MTYHTLCIPTNRFALKSIESYFYEIDSIADLNKINFVLSDSSDEETQELHSKCLQNLQRKTTKVIFYHVKQNAFDEEVKQKLLQANIPVQIISLVVGNYFSYGRSMNRLAIICNCLNSPYLHRRDSDTFPQQYSNSTVSPLEVELTYLGNSNHSKQPNVMVGSSYIGDWGIDYKSVQEEFSVLMKLFSLSKPTYDESELSSYIYEKYIKGSEERYCGVDELSFEKSNYIDAGNFSLFEIFRFIPVSPACVTSGTDYIYHDILSLYNDSKLYHNRRVIHEYTHDRYSLISPSQYNLSKVFSRVMTLYNKEVFKNISKNRVESFSKLASIMAFNYEKLLTDPIFDSTVYSFIDKIIDVYTTVNKEEFAKTAIQIKNNKHSIINKTKKDIADYIILLRNWELITESLRNVDLNKYTLRI